ncbi:MAG: hypothetical protein JOZ97_06000 [Candidatus Eremiobacteraeota bacterium]|nr:hypothetical protein [Candidatus Eremiobacteraeota bacterium]
MMLTLLQRPSAFIPPLVSAFLIALIITHVVRFGTVPQPDEGTEAHLFQLLMPLQAILIAFFASVWLPQKRIAALQVLALQIAAAACVLTLVFFLRL